MVFRDVFMKINQVLRKNHEFEKNRKKIFRDRGDPILKFFQNFRKIFFFRYFHVLSRKTSNKIVFEGFWLSVHNRSNVEHNRTNVNYHWTGCDNTVQNVTFFKNQSLLSKN